MIAELMSGFTCVQWFIKLTITAQSQQLVPKARSIPLHSSLRRDCARPPAVLVVFLAAMTLFTVAAKC